MLYTIRSFGLMLTLVAVTSASANSVVLNFDDLPVGSYFQNLTTQGFRLSPSCHIDVFESPTNSNSTVIGWDRSGCLSGGGNPDYLGSSPAASFSSIYIDRFDQPFEFTSLGLAPSSSFSVTSSKGGTLAVPFAQNGGVVSVNGSDWAGLKWIELTYSDPGAPAVRLDALSFSTQKISEPSTLWLLGACGIGFAVARRRASRGQDDPLAIEERPIEHRQSRSAYRRRTS